jgi:hypothetical protein
VVVGKSQGVEKHVNVHNVVFQLEQNTALLLLSYLEHRRKQLPVPQVIRNKKQPFDIMHKVYVTACAPAYL